MEEKDARGHKTTTFLISHALHAQVKMMCLLTKKSMGAFIRAAISDKVKELKEGKKEKL